MRMTSPARLSLAVAALVTAASAAAATIHDAVPVRTPRTGAHAPLADFDTSVKPTDDFYRYVNGRWLTTATIPPDQAGWGVFAEVRARNQAVLHDVLERASRDRAARAGSPARLVGDFYASGMDSAAVEALGARPIADDLQRIAAIHDADALRAELAHLQQRGVRVPMPLVVMQDAKESTRQLLQITQGGLGLPDRDYYLSDAPDKRALRDQYVTHVQRMLALAGDDTATAAAGARTVLAFETRLARASMTRVERRDAEANYHKVTVDSLEAWAPAFGWRAFLTATGIGDPGAVNVPSPRFVREVGAMLTEQPLDDWKTWLRWHLVHASAPALSGAFVDANFEFYGRALTGVQQPPPRWRRVMERVDGDFRGGVAGIGEALGQLYVARAFTPQAKARALEMVENLRAALRDRIRTLDWMSDATREAALAKLNAFQIKIGYPDRWRDYTGLAIARDDWFGNIRRTTEWEIRRNWAKLGHPVDRSEWTMTPPTVNAYYNAPLNEIVFPAGILQPPFFDPQADDAVNYGAIGTGIGHEMTHGFDDQGRKFDAQGNLRDWWTPEDAAHYKERSDRVKRQFDGYVAIDTLHVNGQLTLGENTADLGGVAVAYAALQKALVKHGRPGPIDGLTPEQRFFVAYARGWRQNMRPEALRLRIATDPHSPGPFRCNGPLSNLPEFAHAFGAKDGDPMVRAEADRARIW
jgi:putative endopeptidase